MEVLSVIVKSINSLTNVIGEHLFSSISLIPGWLSNTIIAALITPILLIAFKYTSNQKAIGRVKNKIKENLLAMRLYKDNIAVILKSQASIFCSAVLLLVHSLRPMLIMIVPVSFLLVQMGLWYQYRPVKPNESIFVAMSLNNSGDQYWPEIKLHEDASIKVAKGPARILSKKMICWEIVGIKGGSHYIKFEIDNQEVTKHLSVGQGFRRISAKRPQDNWAQVLFHPVEKPFESDSPIKSISIEYPSRGSITSGSNSWVVYFFIASMVIAFILKPLFNVKM